MTLKIGLSVIAACGFSSTAFAKGLEWGSFKDNGCLGNSGQRVYSSVLWNIPDGQDWIGTCLNTSALVTLRDGSQVKFPEPTTCTKSSINEALGVASLVAGAPGLVYKPAGAISLVLGAGSYAMEKAGIGAINVWGLFHVVDKTCPGAPLQTIGVTTPGHPASHLVQSFARGSLNGASGLTRVCFANFGDRNRIVRHDDPVVGPYTRIGTNGHSQCGNFPSSARVKFRLFEDGVEAQTSKPMVMSLRHFEGGTVTFDWKD